MSNYKATLYFTHLVSVKLYVFGSQIRDVNCELQVTSYRNFTDE